MSTESTKTQEKKLETLEEAAMTVLAEAVTKNASPVDVPLQYLNRLKGAVYQSLHYLKGESVRPGTISDIKPRFDNLFDKAYPILKDMTDIVYELAHLSNIEWANGKPYTGPDRIDADGNWR